MSAVPRAVWPGASTLTSLGFSLLVCKPDVPLYLEMEASRESQNFCPKSPLGAGEVSAPASSKPKCVDGYVLSALYILIYSIAFHYHPYYTDGETEVEKKMCLGQGTLVPDGTHGLT